MSQFCASAAPPIAIEILNTAASVVDDSELLIGLFEETLHAYFTQTTNPNPIVGM